MYNHVFQRGGAMRTTRRGYRVYENSCIQEWYGIYSNRCIEEWCGCF